MKMNEKKIGAFWLCGSLVLVSVAQLLFKHAMLHFPFAFDFHQSIYQEIKVTAELQPFVFPLAIGLFAYGLSVLCWMSALGRLPLSLAYPLLSLSYLLVYIGAMLMPALHEIMNGRRLCGILLLLSGAILIVWPTKSDVSVLP